MYRKILLAIALVAFAATLISLPVTPAKAARADFFQRLGQILPMSGLPLGMVVQWLGEPDDTDGTWMYDVPGTATGVHIKFEYSGEDTGNKVQVKGVYFKCNNLNAFPYRLAFTKTRQLGWQLDDQDFAEAPTYPERSGMTCGYVVNHLGTAKHHRRLSSKMYGNYNTGVKTYITIDLWTPQTYSRVAYNPASGRREEMFPDSAKAQFLREARIITYNETCGSIGP